MKKFLIGIVVMVTVIFSTTLLLLGIVAVNKINNLRKELSQTKQSVILTKQQIQQKEGQIAQLSQKVFSLSKKLKAAKTKNYELSYKLQSGDTLYNLFGPGWVKIAKLNKIECINNLQAGKTINFQGYIHRVKKGDSFSKLFGKDWKRIAYLNGFCPQQAEILPVGQKLKVPTT